MSSQQKFPYQQVINQNAWLFDGRSKLILSPDADGLLCGLALSAVYGSEIVGFYDGKVMAITPGTDYRDCCFIDMEVNREVKGSFGHHMITFNKNFKPRYREAYVFKNCIQPNEIRQLDAKGGFQSKYPFGTIHLLVSMMQHRGDLSSQSLDIEKSRAPFLFADGVINNLYGYIENCLDWLDYLGLKESGNIVGTVLFENDSTLSNMKLLNEFYRRRDALNPTHIYKNGEIVKRPARRRGDKLILSDSKDSGNAVNFVLNTDGTYKLFEQEHDRIVKFLKMIGDEHTGFCFKPELWNFSRYNLTQFNKETVKQLSGAKFADMMNRRPFSLAITSGNEVECTLESHTGQPSAT